MGFVLNTARRRLAACAVVAVAAAGVVAVAPAADASSRYHQPVTAGSHYLALGDSVAFGYREPANLPAPTYGNPKSFVGYPEDIGSELGVRTVNPSCPGETSASLVDDNLPSYACETATGYRTNFPLHVKYHDSQLLFAVVFLQRHHDTSLVSLAIGANDGFLCQATTADHCASELPTVLKKITKNVQTTLRTIRDVARYKGQIVIVNYYSTDYTNPLQNAQSLALNKAMDEGARPYHVSIADGYGTFKRAAAQAGGDTCAAGLLTTLSTGGCGVHPSVAGQELLSGAVERVVNHR